jgi:hypothetical protein
VRGGHSIHDASGETTVTGWMNTQFNACTGDATTTDGCQLQDSTVFAYTST